MGNDYLEISKLYMPNFPLHENHEEKSIIQNLTDEELHRLIYKLFDGNDNNEEKPNIITTNLLKDLDIFTGDNNNFMNSVLNKINRTETTIGKIYLQKLLYRPIKDLKQLKTRQSIVKNILRCEILLDDLIEQLIIIKKTESSLIWFWKNLDQETLEHIKTVYFSDKLGLNKLNNYETSLSIYNDFSVIVSPILAIFSPIIALIIPYIIINLIIGISVNFKTYMKIAYSNLNIGILLGTRSNLPNIITKLWWGFTYFLGVKNSIENATNRYNVIKILHERLNDVSNFVKACKNLSVIISNNSILEKTINNNYLDEFLKIFEDNTFNTYPNIFSNKGKILTSFYRFSNNKSSIVSLLEYIGKLDAYIGIAKLYKEQFLRKKAKFCFVDYYVSNKPIIDAQGLWHPCLEHKKIVENNISIESKNLIITGPNAGGKSTFIKSLIISTLLSQTIGLAAAKTFKLTPFSYIDTYINVPDCKGFESLFEAEAHRCLKHIDKLNNFSQKEFSLVVMDEIFTGTNNKEGLAAAWAFCKKIGNYENSIGIITTHFHYLTNLEKIEKKFVNYKINIKYNDNKIIFPYKISKGINNKFIALDLLEIKGFDKNLIKDAKYMMSYLNDIKYW